MWVALSYGAPRGDCLSSGSSASLSVYKEPFSGPGSAVPAAGRGEAPAVCSCLTLSMASTRLLLQPRVANGQPGPVPPQPVSFALCSTCCDGAALAATPMWQDVPVPGPRDGGVQGCAFPAWMSGKAAPLHELGLWSSVWGCCFPVTSLSPCCPIGRREAEYTDAHFSVLCRKSPSETWATCGLRRSQALCFSRYAISLMRHRQLIVA